MIRSSIVDNYDVSQSIHSNALVSVIIPCFNYGRFLPDSVASVQEQTHTNWECVIINDGSTDDTTGVAERLAGEDARIKVIHQENHGPSSARNRGLDVALGQYIQFLDADDIIAPGKIELQLNLLAGARTPGLAYSDYRYCDRDNPAVTVSRDRLEPPRFKTSRPVLDLASRWETEFSMPIHSFLFDARFFKELGIRFDESLGNHEDWDCWMRIFVLDPVIFHVPEPLTIYRIHSDSICANTPRMLEGFCTALEKQIALNEEDPELKEALMSKYRYVKRLYKGVIRSRRLEIFRTNIHLWADRNLPLPIQRIIYSLFQFVIGNHHKPVKEKE